MKGNLHYIEFVVVVVFTNNKESVVLIRGSWEEEEGRKLQYLFN